MQPTTPSPIFKLDFVSHQSYLESHPAFGPASIPHPLFQWYPQSNEILLNLSMKW
jgi:hypothetical protein